MEGRGDDKSGPLSEWSTLQSPPRHRTTTSGPSVRYSPPWTLREWATVPRQVRPL